MMRRSLLVLIAGLVGLTSPASAQDRPAELGLPIFTFISGPAAAYGMPTRNGAELIVERINAAGGLGGTKIRPIFVDEAQGGAGVVTEYRKLAADPNLRVAIAALSSGNCLALAPVAEELKMPMLAWNCDTHQLLLKDKYKYVWRSNSSTIPEFLAYALYLMEKKPDFKRVAIINPDYAFGRDAADIFKQALKTLKPDIEIVAELYPKLGTSNFNTEISRLASVRPDVIFSNLWGADLENFVRQALPRGLFKESQVVLALGETILQRIELPDGVIVGVLGDGWWMSPTAKANAQTQDFVKAYHERYKEYPVFPTFKMVNTILFLKEAFDKVIKANDGKWPSREQLVAVFENLKVETMTGTVAIRDDNDGLVDQVVGVTRKVDGQPFPIIADMVRYPGSKVTPPSRTEPAQWISGLTPQFLRELPKPGSYK